jgi:hypothetical protein
MRLDDLVNFVVSKNLSEHNSAIAFLWWKQKYSDSSDAISSELKSFFLDNSIGAPNFSRVVSRLNADRRVMAGARARSYKLKASAIRDMNEELLNEITVDVPNPGRSALLKSLEVHASKIKDLRTQEFIREAIKCAEIGAKRAAVIMSWCGAVASLQEYIFLHHLDKFNDDAIKNGVLKRSAVTMGDIRDISKESLFLDSLVRISVIDSSTKKALKRCLEFRNECGHPSDMKFGDAAVENHIESLLLNVFDQFSA